MLIINENATLTTALYTINKHSKYEPSRQSLLNTYQNKTKFNLLKAKDTVACLSFRPGNTKENNSIIIAGKNPS